MGRTSHSRKRKRGPAVAQQHHHTDEEEAIDRISELPDPLISQILSFLEMKDAVKTSVLSQRWKLCWTEVDSLVFDCPPLDHHNPYSSVERLEEFILFVDRTLNKCAHHNKIKKFSISAFFRDFKGDEYVDQEFSFSVQKLLHKWVNLVIEKKVEVLKLGLKGLDYVVPDSLYRSSSITHLEIDEVGKHCYEMEEFTSLVPLSRSDDGGLCYNKRFDLRWNKLKVLYLKCVHVRSEFMEEILSGCPVLETVALDEIGGLRFLEISSPNVIELRILNCSSNVTDGSVELYINAPLIKKLEVSGIYRCFDCCLMYLPSLESANLTLSYSHINHWENEEADYDSLSSNMIDNLLHPVRDADDLIVGAQLLQALSLYHLTRKHRLIFQCEYLTIHSPICMHEVPGIVCLLKSSPYLEKLVVRVMPWQCDVSKYKAYVYGEHINEVFTSFTGVTYLGKQKKKFLCLKNVKIDCREKLCSCHKAQSGDGACLELEIAVYIIKHAPLLEKLVILPSKSNCSKCGAGYLSVLSSKLKVGKRAVRWELKKTDTTIEFICST